MDIKKVKNQWAEYCAEFENSEEMDIEKHINMASKVGSLILEIEKLKKDIKDMMTGYEDWETNFVDEK